MIFISSFTFFQLDKCMYKIEIYKDLGSNMNDLDIVSHHVHLVIFFWHILIIQLQREPKIQPTQLKQCCAFYHQCHIELHSRLLIALRCVNEIFEFYQSMWRWIQYLLEALYKQSHRPCHESFKPTSCDWILPSSFLQALQIVSLHVIFLACLRCNKNINTF